MRKPPNLIKSSKGKKSKYLTNSYVSETQTHDHHIPRHYKLYPEHTIQYIIPSMTKRKRKHRSPLTSNTISFKWTAHIQNVHWQAHSNLKKNYASSQVNYFRVKQHFTATKEKLSNSSLFEFFSNILLQHLTSSEETLVGYFEHQRVIAVERVHEGIQNYTCRSRFITHRALVAGQFLTINQEWNYCSTTENRNERGIVWLSIFQRQARERRKNVSTNHT